MPIEESKIKILKNRVLSKKRSGKQVVATHRKYVNSLNQICSLDSNYEYNYALYLDYLYDSGQIAWWIRNTTKFRFSEAVETSGRKQQYYRPDFIVFHKDGTYDIHEVKCRTNERSEAVLAQFAKDYRTLKVIVVNKDYMLSLQRHFKDKLWGWVIIK